jgi:PAS domain S-box-containing protein
MKFINIKYVLVVVFLLLNTIVYYITEKNTQSKIEYSKYHHLNKLQLNYESFMIAQSDKADVIYETTLNTKGLTTIISKAWETQDKNERDSLRKELLTLLEKRYEKFKKQGLLQYHFVFPDNTVFLRVHKPNKYGDDLSKVRLDFAKVNETKQIIRGFSQGRTAHAFRNVYPIFDKSKKHIGAIEISYPSELLQKNLNKISEIHSHFLVNKNIFDSKMWEREDRILKYVPSIEHKEYLLTLSKVHFKKDHIFNMQERIDSLRKDIDRKFKEEMMFSLVSDDADDFKIISFFPVYQNVTGNVSAWVVAYNDAPVIYPAVQDSYYIRLISFFIFAILLYFIYKTNKQKNTISRLLTSYDDNVIFSTTDLKGNITHVSKAFCKISGYSENELLGKPHSIIRHPDMSKNTFKDMWKTIKEKNSWKGEIKNTKKDGSFYWVEAEIEPLYDDSNKHVGYSAIRHDITDHKELKVKEVMLLEQSKMAAMGEMLESIAHQWRQPLSVITTSTSSINLFKESGILTDEQLVSMIKNIEDAAMHLSHTIDDFRNFYKKDSKPKSFSLESAIERSQSLIVSKLKNRNITVIKNFEDTNVIGFENEIIQVFMNLFNNSIDALSDFESTNKTIQISISIDGNNTIIYFQDNAGGIPKNIISKVFDHKFTTKSEKGGSGIGLYMSKQIIEKSNGSIEVVNKEFDIEENKYNGACFIIKLPNDL